MLTETVTTDAGTFRARQFGSEVLVSRVELPRGAWLGAVLLAGAFALGLLIGWLL